MSAVSNSVLGNASDPAMKSVALCVGRNSARVYNFALEKWTTIIEGIGDAKIPFQTIGLVTPRLADEFLATRVEGSQRGVERRRVQMYSKSMLEGHWRVNNDDVTFDRDGHLTNGQHRLSAIVQSQQAVRMSFKFGVEDNAILTIDEGRTRTTLDVIRITGQTMTKAEIGAVNYLYEQKNRKAMMPREDKLIAAQRHCEAARFACQVNKSPFARGPFHAALLRAYYYYSTSDERARLQKFIDIINTSICENGELDGAAIVLRNYMDKSRNENTGTARDNLFRKTEAAIQYFMSGDKICRLYGNDYELFPLPEEM